MAEYLGRHGKTQLNMIIININSKMKSLFAGRYETEQIKNSYNIVDASIYLGNLNMKTTALYYVGGFLLKKPSQRHNCYNSEAKWIIP